MAKDVSKNPWIFDGTTQGEGVGNGGVFDHPIYIKYIVYDSGVASADGTFTVLDANGGDPIAPSYVFDDTAGVAEEPPVQYAIESFVQGIYIQALPTGGRVLVYHGRV